MAAKLSHPKPKRPDRSALDSVPEPQEESSPRFVVRIERHALRSLDEDNFKGGCKALIDCLRQAEIIPDDDAKTLHVDTVFVKVSRRADQGTRVIVMQNY